METQSLIEKHYTDLNAKVNQRSRASKRTGFWPILFDTPSTIRCSCLYAKSSSPFSICASTRVLWAWKFHCRFCGRNRTEV